MKQFVDKRLVAPAFLVLLVALVWSFPLFWYRAEAEGPMRWLGEETEIPGWGFRAIPVGEAAERALVADRTFNGVFTNAAGRQIHVFSAKRYQEKANEVGLFIHTPDRCWVDIGWKLEPESLPTFREVQLHGARIPVERRVYNYRGRRELVYFFGLQGGAPLPYRLDHYFSTALRSADTSGRRDFLRASDTHFWRRLWDSFAGRREFRGPKQFIRISTAVSVGGEAAADETLQQFLERWLMPADYQQESAQWKMAQAAARESTQPPAP